MIPKRHRQSYVNRQSAAPTSRQYPASSANSGHSAIININQIPPPPLSGSRPINLNQLPARAHPAQPNTTPPCQTREKRHQVAATAGLIHPAATRGAHPAGHSPGCFDCRISAMISLANAFVPPNLAIIAFVAPHFQPCFN